MLIDREKYTESGYIGEELIGDSDQQLKQRCLSVQQSLRNNDFSSIEETLRAYNVSDTQFKLFYNKF